MFKQEKLEDLHKENEHEIALYKCKKEIILSFKFNRNFILVCRYKFHDALFFPLFFITFFSVGIFSLYLKFSFSGLFLVSF